MNKRLWIILGILVVASIGGIFYLKNSNSDDQKMQYVENLDGSKLIKTDDVAKAMQKANGGKAITSEEKSNIIPDHYLGPTDAKVTVLMYEDFACTHCQAFNVYAEQIMDEYKDRVLFIFRDFSLAYPNSTATLSAGEAVAKLGGNEAFWKMDRQLFSDEKWVGQAVSTNERKKILGEYAKKSGVDQSKFEDALVNTETNGIQDKIDRDKKLGEKANVSGTPTWIVNGEKIDSINDTNVRKAINGALKKVGEKVGKDSSDDSAE